MRCYYYVVCVIMYVCVKNVCFQLFLLFFSSQLSTFVDKDTGRLTQHNKMTKCPPATLTSWTAIVALGLAGGAIASHLLQRRKSLIIHRGVSARAAQSTVHNGTVYLSGQVGTIDDADGTLKGDITEQTEQALAKIDMLLLEAGSSRSKILSTQIWVKDVSTHFGPMNVVWNDWVGGIGDKKGVRACVESAMARPSILVEVQVIAAL